jgi:putative ABC transport system permease protein
MNDLRFAGRQLAKAPGFTIAAVATLALGIGANTAMFSLVNGILLRPLPYEEPGRLVHVWEAPRPGQRNSVSPGVFSDWREHATTLESLAAFSFVDWNLTGEGGPERVNGVRISASGLRILRARPVLGRLFAPDEDQPGKDKVVVLTDRIWRRRFGGDAGIVGRGLRLNAESHTVVGVLPRGFLPWEKPDFVVPLAIEPPLAANRGNHYLRVIGRLAPGVSVAPRRT